MGSQKLTACIAFCFAFAFTQIRAEADLVFYETRAAFDTAFPGSPLEDFEGANVADAGFLPFESPLNSETDNAAFSPGDILPGIEFRSSDPADFLDLFAFGKDGVSPPAASKGIGQSVYTESLDIFFDPNVRAVGVDVSLVFSSADVTASIYGTSGLLGNLTFSAGQAGSPTFFGVSSTSAIVRINLDDVAQVDAITIDNIAFAVPEPASIVLWILAGSLGALIFRHRSLAR